MKNQIILLVLFVISLAGNAQNLIFPLWEKDPPNYRETTEVPVWDSTDIVWVSLVQHPDMAVYLPSRKSATGEAVVICPGGGYSNVVYDWEGADVAKWLNSKGIAAFVLKYRLPGLKSNIVRHLSPLLDAQRAIRLVRYNAKTWNIDPCKIGIMGFSAGGHLASVLSTHFDKGVPTSSDSMERISCRPDFSILVYPVISLTEEFTHTGSKSALLGEAPDKKLVRYFSSELQVTKETPPAILIHSFDDNGVSVENSIAYFKALLACNIRSEMHIYPYGGHGYSLAIGQGHLSTWPDRVIDWIHYINKDL